MSQPVSETIEVGDRLPAITLSEVPSGRPVRWRRTVHESSVVFFPHPGCDRCRGYLGRLEAGAGQLGAWGARPLVVLPGQAGERPDGLVDSLVVDDPDGGARRRCGVAPDQSVLLVADRFGEVWYAVRPGPDHDLPPVDTLREWVRFLGTQCPECGVADSPQTDDWTLVH